MRGGGEEKEEKEEKSNVRAGSLSFFDSFFYGRRMIHSAMHSRKSR